MNRHLAALRRALCTCGLAALAAVPAGAAVNVALQPASLNVTPGADFEISIDITQAGSEFNGYTAMVTFDPAALTFVPLSSSSLQQGCLMTGACSAACGATFHRFTPSGDSLSISNTLLCDQIFLTGPGNLYKLKFHASNTAQSTWVRFRHTSFLREGVYVTPVATVDAHIVIGTPLDAGPAPAVAAFAVRAEPNPARGPVVFALESDRAGGVQVEVHDLAGRLVRRFDMEAAAGGVARVRWDGRTAAGERARPGVYLVTARSRGRIARARVALLD